MKKNKRSTLVLFFIGIIFLVSMAYSKDIKDPINYWISKEFNQTTLSKEEQLKEFKWFKEAAKPYKGINIHVVSERIATHWYEANTLAKAFEDITGINVVHELTGEDDVIKKIQTQIDMDINLYDAYINDSDLIGTHYRTNKVYTISNLIKKAPTLPTLDLDDFMGLSFTSDKDGIIYQLPDQQFANLYWYRADWFARKDLKRRFKEIFGYKLDVPVNWSAYEDIANFFTNHVKFIEGKRIYGHMDYGKDDPSIGWRFSDAWLSMAGAGDIGLPNGYPVDEWGIRVEGCNPVGASVKRGGAANGAASIYALRKFNKWLREYAPPNAIKMNFTQAGKVPAQGTIAQQIFWYTAFTSDMTKPRSPVVDSDGNPKWKMAPSPHGVYWEKGMKLGYQDAGSWTFLKSTPKKQREAAWLYAQFLVSKSVSLKKTIVGLTPIRKSDMQSKEMSVLAPRLGGLVEFYRSKARDMWTPTGLNVPDYPLLSEVWWKYIPRSINGEWSEEKTMNKIASEIDLILKHLSTKKNLKCAPIMKPINIKVKPKKGKAPKKKLINEKPNGLTIDYFKSLQIYDEIL